MTLYAALEWPARVHDVADSEWVTFGVFALAFRRTMPPRSREGDAMVSRWRKASAAGLLAAIVTAFVLVSVVAVGVATVARRAGLSPERTTLFTLGAAVLGSLAVGAYVFRRVYHDDPPAP